MLIPTAPAIVNAIRQATGVLITHLPATADKIRAALRQQAQENSQLTERKSRDERVDEKSGAMPAR